MADAFVWFHNDSRDARRTQAFYQTLLGWQPSEGPAGMSSIHEWLVAELGGAAGRGRKK